MSKPKDRVVRWAQAKRRTRCRRKLKVRGFHSVAESAETYGPKYTGLPVRIRSREILASRIRLDGQPFPVCRIWLRGLSVDELQNFIISLRSEGLMCGGKNPVVRSIGCGIPKYFSVRDAYDSGHGGRTNTRRTAPFSRAQARFTWTLTEHYPQTHHSSLITHHSLLKPVG
jgi:hypothetical protein